MLIRELEHINCAYDNGGDRQVERAEPLSRTPSAGVLKRVVGGASTFANGYTFATYGFANADAFGAAQGQLGAVNSNTNVSTSVGYGQSFSQGSAVATAKAADPYNFSSSYFRGVSTFTGFKGSASTRDFRMNVNYSFGS